MGGGGRPRKLSNDSVLLRRSADGKTRSRDVAECGKGDVQPASCFAGRNVCGPLRVPTRMASTRIVRVLVRWRAGPTWRSGPPEDQPGWDEHAAFIDDLIARGTLVMGGPFADHSGSFSILENVGEDEARELVGRDPFVANGVFVLEGVRAWNVYVDELTPSI